MKTTTFISVLALQIPWVLGEGEAGGDLVIDFPGVLKARASVAAVGGTNLFVSFVELSLLFLFCVFRDLRWWRKNENTPGGKGTEEGKRRGRNTAVWGRRE